MSFCRWKPVSQGHTAGGQRALYLPLSQWAASARPRVDARSVPCLPGWPSCVALQHGSLSLVRNAWFATRPPRTPQSHLCAAIQAAVPKIGCLWIGCWCFCGPALEGTQETGDSSGTWRRGLGKGVGRVLFWPECLLCVCRPSTCAASEPRAAFSRRPTRTRR